MRGEAAKADALVSAQQNTSTADVVIAINAQTAKIDELNQTIKDSSAEQISVQVSSAQKAAAQQELFMLQQQEQSEATSRRIVELTDLISRS